MVKKFGALAEFRRVQTDLPDQVGENTGENASVLVPLPAIQEPGKARGRPAGKRSNPEYEPTTVLLRKQTKRKTSRLLEDINSKQDLSDLIESLLSKWVSEHS